MRILVFCGGESEEREVSLRSGCRVAMALAECGHRLAKYDYRGGALPTRVLMEAADVDALFLVLHGGAGEDGRLQARLCSCGIHHYTGSTAKGAAMAMSKDVAKSLVSQVGVPVARGMVIKQDVALPPLPFPVVIKPRNGGSSIGLHIVKTADEWRKLTPLGGFLCEEYLSGREFTVGLLGEKALPVVEIRSRSGNYDYQTKYTAGACEELCPAPITASYERRLQDMAKRAFNALGLRDYARVDFREDANGEPRFLEANALPGMTATSLFPLAAEAVGIPFGRLCEKMAAMAAERRYKYNN